MAATPKLQGSHATGLPVTSIAAIPGTDHALVASGSCLLILDLRRYSPQSTAHLKRWKIFERERVHRVNIRACGESGDIRGIVTGGREAVFIRISLRPSKPTLEVLACFQVDDFIGDGAFLENDVVLLSTLHNTLLIYRLPPGSSPLSPADIRTLPPLIVLQAPLLPLLWYTRFSSSQYDKAREIRLAGGTMWGDAYLWDVGTAKEVRNLVEEFEQQSEDGLKTMTKRRAGGLRRFVGHKGSIFSASFSPPSAGLPSRLLTASDDRTLRIFPLPSFDSTVPLEAGTVPLTISEDTEEGSGKRETIWGHDGRVWRAEWLEEGKGLVSIGEDATLRYWTTSPSSPPTPSPASSSSSSSSAPHPYSLSSSFSLGHDGRSLWSLCPISLPPTSTAPGFKGVLTGGADGGVRCWPLPRSGSTDSTAGSTSGSSAASGKGRGKAKAVAGEKIKVFAVAALNLTGGESGERGEVVASVSMDGSFHLSLVPSASSSVLTSVPPPPASVSKPFHCSPALFGGASSAVSLFLLPSSSTSDRSSSSSHPPALRFIAFSNRGGYTTCTFAVTLEANEPQVRVKGEVKHAEIEGVRATEVAFFPLEGGEGLLRAVVWDRASSAVHLLDLPSPSSSPSTPSLLASFPLTPTSATPASLVFLSSTFVLLGLSNGSISLLFFTSTPEGRRFEKIVELSEVHGDGVADMSVLSTSGGRWEVETAGKDGMKCVIEIVVEDGGVGEAKMAKVDERVVVGRGGSVEKIFPSRRSGADSSTYLAFSGGRAILLDDFSRALLSFPSPGKKTPSQLVSSPNLPSMSYYRLVSGLLHRSASPSPLSSAASTPPAVLIPPLHGREIRDTKSMRTRNGRTLLATAAENGVLAVSEFTTDGQLCTLYVNSHMPSSLKSLAWSTFSTNDDNVETYSLFVSGSQELLAAFSITVVESSSCDGAETLRLRVLPAAMELAEEGNGEIRTMGIAVVPLPSDGVDGRVGVVSGYSDGSIKLWSHSAQDQRFSLVASTPGLGKCVLVIDAVEVELGNGENRTLVVSGGSDGLVALRDLTSLCLTSIADKTASILIPEPFLTFRPHQSGINALALRPSPSSLIVATGGDDNALSVQHVSLSASATDDQSCADLGPSTLLADAHASTIQGLDFLPSSTSQTSTFLVSSAVDQRLNLYSLTWSPSSTPPTLDDNSSPLSLELVDSTCLEVADCGTQEVLEEEDGKVRVVVGGIGVEVVKIDVGG